MIAINTIVAILAFCAAFILAVSDLPETLVICGISAMVGLFGAYSAVVATLLIFGQTRLMTRLLACCIAILCAIFLVWLCFGAMNDFDSIANHFLVAVMIAILWLGLLRNLFGWTIHRREEHSDVIAHRQYGLWILFSWMFGVALLATFIRSDAITSESLLGTGLAAFLATTIVFTVIATTLTRAVKIFLMLLILTLMLLGATYNSELYFLTALRVPRVYGTNMVRFFNIGIIVAALCAGISLRLLDYRLCRASLPKYINSKQNQ